ncbi:competence protein ComFB [Caldicoprobacter guelmensis]|uniref:late competence development ComFB family protein n=1 Tax=Caldicoprobacter guelmensis TaxID=1170224 RepID=UPI001FB03F65|nr:late competence development ComFB family protein [Caldicoprobacter guelmensis]MBM7581275.1 competence protein ComFB [Caldicoprobacter guelmensis]
MAMNLKENMRPKNYMEDVVFHRLDDILASTDCCRCQRCRMDIAAYALNQLPCKYVVTHEGEVYSKLLELQRQFETDVIIAILKAIEVVKKNPRHDGMQLQGAKDEE